MEIEEEDFERPASVSSISKVLEKVKVDSTPTAEKELDFAANGMVASPADLHSPAQSSGPSSPSQRRRTGSRGETGRADNFKEYLLGSERISSPISMGEETDEDDEEASGLEIHGLGIRDEPRTPTQTGFGIE